ncbi:FecR family protein [Paraburkholderia unamae]|nr:FecR family protein [Paraburkholderia unamae]
MPSRTLRGLAALVLSVVCAAGAAQTTQSDQKDQRDRTNLPAPEASAAVAAASAAGKAVVVVGHASVANARGTSALASGASLAVGDTIETSADGYVYVTTVDHGFISVRPNSSLSIERYDYDASAPERTVIKLTLHRGVVREISGKGAQAARDHYRMNTPVAALGVRGTDFTVFTNANVTSASVRSGGIVMTPLGGACASSGAGPCEGTNAAQLFADLSDKALQVTRGSAHPVVLDTRLTPLTTEGAGQKAEDSAARAAVAVTHVDPGVVPVELTLPLTPATTPTDSSSSAPATSTPATPPATTPTSPSTSITPPAQTTEAQQIFWGRFTPLANLPADSSLATLEQGKDYIGYLKPFTLVRSPQTDMVLPQQGVLNFTLDAANSAAYLINNTTGVATAASLSNGALAVDFGTNRFTTSLQASVNGSTYKVSSYGDVLKGGILNWDVAAPAAVIGALAGKNVTQAGYIFNQNLSNNQSLAGATLWSR